MLGPNKDYYQRIRDFILEGDYFSVEDVELILKDVDAIQERVYLLDLLYKSAGKRNLKMVNVLLGHLKGQVEGDDARWILTKIYDGPDAEIQTIREQHLFGSLESLILANEEMVSEIKSY